MASKEQSVTLLRRNKRAQVEALNTLGFNLTESARAADFPMYIKWGAGLLDLNVAANRKSDGKKFFFTVEEWQSLSATEQSLFLLRGIRVRAHGTSFIIAADTIINKAFGATGIVVDGMHSFSTYGDLYSYFNAREETEIVAAAYATSTDGIVGSPAAEAALAYKAFTLQRDGLEDTSEWCLPTPGHLYIMGLYINEINAAFAAVWSSDFGITKSEHWSCCKWDKNNVYRINFANGNEMWYVAPNTNKAVRPICLS